MIKSSHQCRTPEHNILGQFWRSNFKVILRICFFQTYFWRSSPVFHTDFWWFRIDQNSRRDIGIVLKVKMSMSFFKYTLFTHIFEGSSSAIHRYFFWEWELMYDYAYGHTCKISTGRTWLYPISRLSGDWSAIHLVKVLGLFYGWSLLLHHV